MIDPSQPSQEELQQVGLTVEKFKLAAALAISMVQGIGVGTKEINPTYVSNYATETARLIVEAHSLIPKKRIN